jgi:hypothetical protein
MLNNLLYSRMAAKLAYQQTEAIRVVNEDQELQVYYQTDPVSGRPDMVIVRWGEAYYADCPFCHDTRGRLSVSYYYNTIDPVVKRTPTLYLWRCYNEDCQERSEYRQFLRALIGDDHGFNQDAKTRLPAGRPPRVKRTQKTELDTIDPPGQTVPLTDLPPGHPALLYLAGRGFDPTELVRDWEVGYCLHTTPRTAGAMCLDRIIIPVIQREQVVGYQARFVGATDKTGPPKYLTYYPKSQTLYGFDAARQAGGRLAVVEGATDAWRAGAGRAVARFGKRLSRRQAELLIEASRQADGWRPLVFVPDANDPQAVPETFRDVADLVRLGYAGRMGLLPLPPGSDPAGLARDDLHYLIDHTPLESVPGGGR